MGSANTRCAGTWSRRLLLAGAVGAALAAQAGAEEFQLMYDLRVHETGGKSAIVSAPGDLVMMDLFAVVNAKDADPANDGPASGYGSFQSSNGGLLGDLLGMNVAPFNAAGSIAGVQRDMDGDGDLDVGTSVQEESSRFLFFRTQQQPVGSGAEGIIVAQVQFLVRSLSEPSTEVNWMPRIRPPNPVFALPHFFYLDGKAVWLRGDSPFLAMGAPVVISGPVIPPGQVQYLSGNIDEHLTISGNIAPEPGTTLTLTKGLEVLSGGSFRGNAHVEDETSGNAGGTLEAEELTIGASGTGVFHQSAGLTSAATLSMGAAGNGTLHQTGGTLNIGAATLGGDGSALLQQSGGNSSLTTLTVNGGGVYELNDGRMTVAGEARIGFDGLGVLRHAGGTSFFNGALNLGGKSDSQRGRLEITGGTLNAFRIRVGLSGPAEAVQSGGTVRTSDFGIGRNATTIGSGTYTLNEGILETSIAGVDDGILVQNGGQFTVSSTLWLTSAGPATARMELRGGSLIANRETVGLKGPTATPATFVQDGGTHVGKRLEIRPVGRYVYTGGSFRLNEGLVLQGEFDFGGSSVTLTFGDNSFADMGRGTILNAKNAGIVAGAGTLLSFPAGFDPLTDLGRLETQGLVHVAGQPLVIPADKSVSGSGTIIGDLTNEGLLSPGNSPGAIAVEGKYVQSNVGKLLSELDGTDAESFDTLSITGAANLAGLLEVKLLEDFVPSASDRFTILIADAITGRFANAADRIEVAGGSFEVIYSDNSVTLANFVAVPEPAGLLPLAALAAMIVRRRRR